ncbi:MAG: metal ABC transporter permease [Dethiobacter sp.]|nr:MAG: metal ABC transporter permease [Dethiobacter sp.]
MEMLAYSFMQRAFLAVLMVGLLCSVLSFFVVLNKLSFMGAGISHAVLGGLAIGVLLGVNPLYTGGAFAVLIALLVGYISKHSKIGTDTVTGIFFVTGMALGITLISFKEGYYPELFSLLFGNVLAVSAADLRFLGVVMALVLLFIFLFFKELLTISFDEELARASGLPVTPLYLGLLVSVALTVVISVLVVGVNLAAALLVIPAATGFKLSRNYRVMLLLAVAVGLISGLGGLVISYNFNTPSGAAIVLCAAAIFFLSLLRSTAVRICSALFSAKKTADAFPAAKEKVKKPGRQ